MVDREKLDELFGTVTDMAAMLLEKNGEFFPIGAVVRANGDIEHVAIHDGDEQPQSQTVIENLTKLFRDQAAKGIIVASAVGFDATVRSPETGAATDAIVTRITAMGYARDVNLPYSLTVKGLFRKIRTVAQGQPSASEGAQDVFV